jgi:hypothetical protein
MFVGYRPYVGCAIENYGLCDFVDFSYLMKRA